MKWITHIILAFFVVKVTEIALMIELLNDYLAYIVVSLFAVLPDIDFILGLKHRSYTHTIYFTATALPLLLFSWKLFLAGWIAIISHLIGDMMTHSGVKLLYPRETIFYLTPPNWRFKTGSGSEFAILGVLIISLILMDYIVAEKVELARIFELSKDHDVTLKLSWIENGVVYKLDCVKVVWTDYKSKIGFIQDGRLKIIDVEQILDAEILDYRKVDREVMYKTVRVKELKRSIWRNKLIISYDGKDFLGTGRDLYELLKENSDKKVRVAYVCSRS